MANPNPSPGTRFKPGVSGNPSGRPKGSLSMTTKLRHVLERAAKEGHDKQIADVLAETVVRMALKGDTTLINLIYDRIDGKVPDNLSINSDDATVTIRNFLLGKSVETSEDPDAG